MKKTIALVILSSILTLGFMAGINSAFAHDNNHENMGKCRFSKCIAPMKLGKAEFSLKDNGQAFIKKAVITRVGTNEFDVSINSIVFTIKTSETTKFLPNLSFKDIAVNKVIDAMGKGDPLNVQIIKTDWVRISQAKIFED